MTLLTSVFVTASVMSAFADVPAPKDSATSIPPECWLIEGDILIPPDFTLPGRLSVQGTYDTSLWPNGVVPYQFDPNVSQVNQVRAINAMAQWEAVGYGSNVDFVPRTNQVNFIHIQSSTGNNSFVGMQGGSQVVNIASWSVQFIIAHELSHALGLWHEQSRGDRDTYVQITYGNICQTCCTDATGNPTSCNSNFDIRSSGGEWGPYDFESVMHYGQCDFIAPGIRCPGQGTTITVLPPNQGWQNLIGQRDHLSYLDQTVMSFLYALPDWVFVDRSCTSFCCVPPGGGSFTCPFVDLDCSVTRCGLSEVPDGGTIWISPGAYNVLHVLDRRMTLRAPLGGVLLQKPEPLSGEQLHER